MNYTCSLIRSFVMGESGVVRFTRNMNYVIYIEKYNMIKTT